MASTTNPNPNAAQRLDMLRGLRLRGQAPVGAICIATDKRDVELFEEIKRPVIEVWKRDAGRLDWSPLAGLWAFVVIRDWSPELRTELFDSIRAGEPQWLDWLATVRGRYEPQIVGNMRLENGQAVEKWVTAETAAEGQIARAAGGWYSYGRI